MNQTDKLELARENIYRASTDAEYDAALGGAESLAASVVTGESATEVEVLRAALRAALVCWRYSYYRGTPSALAATRRLKELASNLEAQLVRREDRPEIRVGFACTEARVLRNQGKLLEAEKLLQSVAAKAEANRSKAQVAIERGCIARYQHRYPEAIQSYLSAASVVDSAHGRVALVHYFAAAGCEMVLDHVLDKGRAEEGTFSKLHAALASLRLLDDPRALQRARRFPQQYAYIRKHEAMIHAFSEERREAHEAMDDAAEVMHTLGSRKGVALIAYSRAVLAAVLREKSETIKYCDEATRLSQDYYPPGVLRAQELRDRVTGNTPSRLHSQLNELSIVAESTPMMKEVLTRDRMDPRSREWTEGLTRALTRDADWARSITEVVTRDPVLLERFWDARTSTAWREAVFAAVSSRYALDLAQGRRPGPLEPTAPDGDEFLCELLAYRTAGISREALAEVLGATPSDLDLVERALVNVVGRP